MSVKIFFYLFASFALLAASGVVFTRHLVKAMLCLLLLFISTAILWLLIGAEFLALLLMLIYVGAVLVLFLFVVMVFDLHLPVRKYNHFMLLGAVLAAFICGGIIYIIWPGFAASSFTCIVDKQTQANEGAIIGKLLYSNYVVAFEMIGLLLLAAIIATIGLTRQGGK